MDRGRRRELVRGLRATRRYLLSHHEPGDWDRCYRVDVGDRGVRLCARCTGVYPGIALGLLLQSAGVTAGHHLAAVALLPAPALLDHAATALTDRRGTNPLRTATGAALGCAYGVGIHAWIAGFPAPWLTAVAAVYGALAALVVAVERDVLDR